jgi:hypothetical protein
MNKKILLPVFVLLALLFGACGFNVNIDFEQGSGKVVTEDRDVSNFDKVELSGIGDVTLVQGDKESLQIEAEDNIIPHIKTEVQNGTLQISFDRKTVIPTKPVKFKLTMRDIRGLESKGASNITSDKINTDQLEASISGTGNINLHHLTADTLSLNVSGAGNLNTDGQINNQKISMSGAGNYNGQDLQSKTADITITGLGRAVVWVTDTLNVTISGTGGVDYYGSPQVTQQISGLGKLNHMGNK